MKQEQELTLSETLSALCSAQATVLSVLAAQAPSGSLGGLGVELGKAREALMGCGDNVDGVAAQLKERMAHPHRPMQL